MPGAAILARDGPWSGSHVAARDRPWNSGLDPTSAGASREAVYKVHGSWRASAAVSHIGQLGISGDNDAQVAWS